MTVPLLPWWIVYERCANCVEENCLLCHLDRHLTLRAVQAQNVPDNALIGPCESKEVLLKRLGANVFKFDEQGEMYLDIEINKPAKTGKS